MRQAQKPLGVFVKQALKNRCWPLERKAHATQQVIQNFLKMSGYLNEVLRQRDFTLPGAKKNRPALFFIKPPPRPACIRARFHV